jgi:hypothetical protein
MNRALQEKRTLVEMARKFGQEPSPRLLEELAALEQDEEERLLREAALRERIAQDLTELFGKVTINELVQPSPEPSAETAAESAVALTEAPQDPQLEITASTPRLQDAVSEYLRRNVRESTVVNPDPVLARPGKNLEAEVKRLEQWISRIAAHGPGSGEVNFRYLDDVNRSTINDNWVLEYDAASKKFQFTKNVGPVETLRFDTSGTTQAPVAGQVHWNNAEDCLDVHQYDGSTLQVGLEQYIQVHNHTSSTLANGTVVRFAGVAEDYETAIVVPHIANGSIPPLYTVGVLTTDIATSSTGRATTLGKVRNLNTTGSDVGETWQVGDLLWLSTDNPGKMTKVKPTAPDIVVSIAAVLKVDATTGILLVRPTVWPRLHYGRFEHFGTISTTSINTSHAVSFTQTIVANGFYIDSATTTRIYAVESGFYDFEFSAQLVSTNSSSKNFWMWARRNGTSSTTARRQTLVGNNVYTVMTCNFALTLEAGEYLEVMYAVDDSAVLLESTPANAFAPAAPSVTITAMQVAL